MIADLLRKLFRPGGRGISGASERSLKDAHAREVRRWFDVDGDRTLRLDYDLDEESLVFDVGGYRGNWAAAIYEKHGCYIHVFEPIPEYAEQIRERFRGNTRISVHELALAERSGNALISVSEDASSLYQLGRTQQEVRLVRASDFMRDHSIARIDLMKINIEGGEYDLIRHLIAENLVAGIRNIQVQFHFFVENAEERLRGLHDALKTTHVLTYHYLFVWENWSLRQQQRR